MIEPERHSTTYLIRLDRRSVWLLSRSSMGELVSDNVDDVWLHPTEQFLLYRVGYPLDNEYVHKALRKRLRGHLNDLRRREKAEMSAAVQTAESVK